MGIMIMLPLSNCQKIHLLREFLERRILLKGEAQTMPRVTYTCTGFIIEVHGDTGSSIF
jgi:hypothetical protein